MKKNIGTNDRIIRLLMASVIASLYFLDAIPKNLELGFLVIAISFVVTGLVSICPVYSIFRFDSCEAGEHEN